MRENGIVGEMDNGTLAGDKVAEDLGGERNDVDEEENLSQSFENMSFETDDRSKKVFFWMSGMGQEECKFL